MDGGKYFLHEHPAFATSWRQKCVLSFTARNADLYMVTSDLCQFGLTSGGLPAKKPTRWLSNSPCLISRLDRKCDGEHTHQHLMGGRARSAQEYPPALCRAIVDGFARQFRADSASEHTPYSPTTPICNLEILATDHEDPPEGDVAPWSEWKATDDVHGGELPPQLVLEARHRELQYLRDRKVYTYASFREAIQRTGKPPLRLKWIDTNKGDSQAPRCRSRLVCTEVKPKGAESVFSATPPLETLRALVAKAACDNPAHDPDPRKLLLVDVSRAHFYADATREVYIRLPEEDPRSRDGGACGKLLKTMYGTLDAADHWAEHYAGVLTAAGFERGRASP